MANIGGPHAPNNGGTTASQYLPTRAEWHLCGGKRGSFPISMAPPQPPRSAHVQHQLGADVERFAAAAMAAAVAAVVVVAVAAMWWRRRRRKAGSDGRGTQLIHRMISSSALFFNIAGYVK